LVFLLGLSLVTHDQAGEADQVLARLARRELLGQKLGEVVGSRRFVEPERGVVNGH
jgi:hypothetical protein